MKIDSLKFGKNGIKYEVIKAILVSKLIEKFSKQKYWLNIYSELEHEEGLFCSIYFINLKENKERIYQIVKRDINLDKYKKFIDSGGEVIQLDMDDFSDDIKQIEKKIEEII